MSGSPGTPDIVLPKWRTVIFMNGCFWHGHDGCRYFVMPKSNVEFWKTKIERNQKRDGEHIEELENLGWKVAVVWECELRTKALRKERLDDLHLDTMEGIPE